MLGAGTLSWGMVAVEGGRGFVVVVVDDDIIVVSSSVGLSFPSVVGIVIVIGFFSRIYPPSRGGCWNNG